MTMKLRPPSIPLINIDPYFSVWSNTDILTDSDTVHWTGKPNTIRGYAVIDGERLRFMGKGEEPTLKQTAFDYDAFSTYYTFENEKITLSVTFTSPVLPDDLEICTRPVTYMRALALSRDGKKHTVKVRMEVSEELCLNEKGQSEVETGILSAVPAVRMGNKTQKVLNRSGDDCRIDWGYVYLSACGKDAAFSTYKNGMQFICAEADISKTGALFLFAYDDICSIEYFGEKLKSYWNRDGKTIEEAIAEASKDYDEVMGMCTEFSDKLYCDAAKAGGEKYAEILLLALRQAMNAHKAAVSENGELLFISKECFSNGCAATVDVSYPSIPLFLIYNPELVKGMMRPVYRFAASDKWKFDFAPHDAGQYPLVNGQVYGLDKETDELRFEMQMPVEECGNMLIMEACVALAEGNADFAAEHAEILSGWVKYLEKYGEDPENQLCTDDFAGHLAHNCNLSLKAIMGLVSYAILLDMQGKSAEAKEYMKNAKRMAKSWEQRSANADGSYRLAFDREGSFSMKYNGVWDKLFGTGLFSKAFTLCETKTNFEHFRPYGMPLDDRAEYTKSDWLIWTATLCDTKADFERFIEPLWLAYNFTESRVPMTDWYFTTTGLMRGFRNRSVVGGFFIKLLDYYGNMVYNID